MSEDKFDYFVKLSQVFSEVVVKERMRMVTLWDKNNIPNDNRNPLFLLVNVMRVDRWCEDNFGPKEYRWTREMSPEFNGWLFQTEEDCSLFSLKWINTKI